MIEKMEDWLYENEEWLMEKFAFSVAICLAFGLIAMSIIL